ncbi:MAG: D-glycero-beta-D-manno-heptose 1-phosphate adenylyltransferase [Bacteroidota bacterium]
MSFSQNLKKKVYSRESLLEKIKDWRTQKCKIVFTNGCFDLLHLGHVDYLAKAADLGDHLIIGVNTDASVNKLKGPTRPITDEVSRMAVLAALESVSAVVLFDEDTPYELIKLLQPDILVKGADYKPEEIVGADIVLANGGAIKTIEFVPGYSTSAIEKRIKEQ